MGLLALGINHKTASLALREKVAFVPGSAFYAAAPQHQMLRLNYSNRPPELIEEGITRLGRALQRRLAQRSRAA